MKVQSINTNYTNYNNQQNRKANADNLSFGMVKLGPTAIETITDCVTAGHSDFNAAKNLKEALKNIRCNLKAAFEQFQCSAHNIHSKFAEEAEEYLSQFKNPEDIELILDFCERDLEWGNIKTVSYTTGWLKSYERNRHQFLGKEPYLCSNEFKIGSSGYYARGKCKDMYTLEPDIIINEVGSLSKDGDPKWDGINGCYHQKYEANIIHHDVVAQLADLLNGLGAKCYDALKSVPAHFNKRLFSRFPEKTHTEQAEAAAREKVKSMLSD